MTQPINPVTGLVVFLGQNQADVSSVVVNGMRLASKELANKRFEEGVVGVSGPLGMSQLFYAENGHVIPVEDYKRTARKAAKDSGQRLEMVRFTVREHLEWIEP